MATLAFCIWNVELAYRTAPAGHFGNAIVLYIYALTSKIYVQTAAFVLR